ncbi:MAG: creatininase family protein [Geminicoccaceae bacterium]
MRLDQSTWQEVEVYLGGSKGIILPIGSTEQHGPTGLVGTDALCAEVVARSVGDKAEALVAPTLNFGMAQHHMAFPGTMTLRPETLLAMLVDLLTSLAHHGFERCFVINGHGGNMATIITAFSELHARSSLGWGGQGGRLRCRLKNWWTPKAVAALQAEIFGDRDGTHATASEIALTQHVFPDTIKKADIDPKLAPKSSGFTDANDFRERYPDGRVGSDPTLSNPDHGRKLFETAVAALAEDYQAFLAED